MNNRTFYINLYNAFHESKRYDTSHIVECFTHETLTLCDAFRFMHDDDVRARHIDCALCDAFSMLNEHDKQFHTLTFCDVARVALQNLYACNRDTSRDEINARVDALLNHFDLCDVCDAREHE